ncbi:MAG: hypothetical protein MK108_09465 [Mariniblastus sp.]|nr:hypothetical protein [Mariniblastus sp.]
MRIDKQAETAPGCGPGKPGTRFSVRTTKLRLMSLFAALILVLIAMKEAKKPERWAWLGWQEKRAEPLLAESPASDLPRNGSDTVPVWGDSIEPGAVQPLPRQEEVSLAQRFWSRSYRNLSRTEKKSLNQVLREAMQPERSSREIDPGFQAVIEKMERLSDDSQAELLGEISLLAPDSEHKRRLSQQLIGFQEHWRAFKMSALRAAQGEPLEAEQRDTLQQIQTLLDPTVYEQVRDRTPVVRPADGPAWLRTWQRIESESTEVAGTGTDSIVSHIQLVSQPESYRGKWVEISGTLRGVDRIEVRRNELGIDHYYVLWLEPSDTNVSPYCVYCLKLPGELPPVGKEFTTLSEDVLVRGIFFKLRSYETTEREMAVCPLILAETCERLPPQQVVARQVWQPPAWLLIAFVVLMPVVAVGIAVGVYQMTRTSQYTISAKSEQRLAGNLERLARDGAIKSDAERVRDLYAADRLPEEASPPLDGIQGNRNENHDER